MKTESRSARPGRARLALALAVGLTPAACSDLVDPARGFEFRAELVAPDTVPLGAEATATLYVYDGAGRRVSGLPVTWTIERSADDLTVFEADTTAEAMVLPLEAVRAGQAEVHVHVSGRATSKPVTAAKPLWSIARGVRIASADSTGEITLVLGEDTLLRTVALAADGRPIPDGARIDWSFNSGSSIPVLGIHVPGYSSVRLGGQSVGTATVTARSAACTGECAHSVTVRVFQIPNTIAIHAIDTLRSFGARRVLNATVTDTHGNTIFQTPVEWALADPADSIVVQVSDSIVTARGNGSARIVARHGELADTATAVVWQFIARIVVDAPPLLELVEGAADTLTVEAFDGCCSGGQLVTRPYSITAASSDPAVVESTVVDGRVDLLARSMGSSIVTVRAELATTQFQVAVNPPLDRLDVRLNSDTLNYIESATIAEAWGRIGADSFLVQAMFASSDSAVATVSSAGHVVAQGAGTAWIHARAGGQADSAELIVRQILASLALRPESALVALDGTIPFQALGSDSAGHPISSFDVSFSSDDPSVLEIGGQGIATARALGQATVTAAAGDFQANADATIIPHVIGAALGSNHGCFIVDGGMLYCWGDNQAGELGDGTSLNRKRPAPSASSLTFTRVAAGISFTCGIGTDGATYCWGAGNAGQLGDGTGSDSSVPVPVADDPGFVHLSASSYHMCGLTAAGAAYCWGENYTGQTGIGVSGDPVTVPTPVAGSISFRALAAGPSGACSVALDGEAYCWGHLGDTSTAEPVRIASTVPVRAISGLGCAVGEDGTLHCRNALEMVPVPDGRAYRDIVAGSKFHCGLGEDGYAYCFGANGLGQLGTGDLIERLQPTRALLDSPATFLITGWITTCAGNAGGGLSCWGQVPGALFGFGATTRPRPVVYP